MVTVPVVACATGVEERVDVKVPVLDVHELLGHLHCKLGLVTPPEKVEQYWNHNKNCNVPHAMRFPGTNHHVPFSLYGDECNLGEATDKVTAIFLHLTLFKPKKVKHGFFLLFCMKDSEMIHENLTTLTPVLKHIVWSCNIAFYGIYPSCNMNGGPLTPTKQRRAGMSLANGVCWACAELKGDWLWHQRTLRLKDIPVARNICFLCDACSEDSHRLRYYDDSEGAPWRATEVDAATFINRKVRPGSISPLPELERSGPVLYKKSNLNYAF